MRLIGLDPGLRATGWGVIDVDGSRLRHVAAGTVRPDPDLAMAARLMMLLESLQAVIAVHAPGEAAIEETFMNRNAASALKLGQARAAAMLAPALARLAVSEYSAKHVKKAVVGTGRATKEQVDVMVRMLLPGARPDSEDAADALAVAICHAHHRTTAARLNVAAPPFAAARRRA